MQKYCSSALLWGALVVTLPHCIAAPKATVPAKVVAPIKALPLLLTKEGQTTYTIAIAADAIPAERTAASELAKYLELISGAKFVIKSETKLTDDAPQILVGATPRVQRLLPKQDWRALGTDGIVIKTVGNKLILAGGKPRGTLYAVYSFLEDTLGVRWWTETENFIPKQSTLRVSAQNLTYAPQIRTREEFYFAPNPNRWPHIGPDAYFGTQLKLNGHFQRQDETLGGHHGDLGWTHTFIQLLPPEKYFREHPEWYSDPANGGKPSTAATTMPLGHVWNLCLSNEAARLELTKNAIKLLHENPSFDMIAIAQNDTPNRCTCDADMAIEKEEGSPSGPLLRFVNKVAADIEKEFPGMQVDTLAYLHTIKPPLLVRPRENVVITLCSIESDFARPLNSDANKIFRDQLTAWKGIAPKLRIWDYTTNFGNTILPHPNLRVLGPNLRFFAANNAIDVFEQGDAYSNGVGDFVQLRAWLLAHLMWNPALDQGKLENEFLDGYYGKAAPHLRAYLETIQDAYIKTGKPLGTYQSDLSWLTLDTMNTATRQYRAASAAVANDPILSDRVRRERMALDHAWILRDDALRKEAKARNIVSEGPADLVPFIIDFVNTGRKFNAGKLTETNDFEQYARQLLARAEPAAPLPDFAQGKDKDDVIDIQENVFTLFQAGTEVDIVEDPTASNGRAAKMAGISFQWVVQYLMKKDDEFLKGRWHCYAVARVVAKEGAVPGPVLTTGLYDTKNNIGTSSVTRTLADMNGSEYQTIDLGVHEMNSKITFWAQPPKRDDIDSVYIDRFLMVREDSIRAAR